MGIGTRWGFWWQAIKMGSFVPLWLVCKLRSHWSKKCLLIFMKPQQCLFILISYLAREDNSQAMGGKLSTPNFIFSVPFYSKYVHNWIYMRCYGYLYIQVKREGVLFICWYLFWSSFFSSSIDLVSDVLRLFLHSKIQPAN